MKEIWKAFHEWLEEKYGGWNEILKIAFDKGEQAAISALEAAKDEIVGICKENHMLLEQLAKFSTKTCISSVAAKQGLKTAIDISVQQGTKQATTPAIKLVAAKACTTQAATKLVAAETAKSGTKKAVKFATAQATKSVTTEVVKATAIKAPTQTVIQATKLTPAMPVASAVSAGTGSVLSSMATPVSIVTGVAQVGFEAAGYKNVGKTVGATGSMTAGGMFGLAAGPPGVVLGAAAGLGVWIAGEIVGGLVDRAIRARSTSSNHERVQSTEGESSECTSREDRNPRECKEEENVGGPVDRAIRARSTSGEQDDLEQTQSSGEESSECTSRDRNPRQRKGMRCLEDYHTCFDNIRGQHAIASEAMTKSLFFPS